MTKTDIVMQRFEYLRDVLNSMPKKPYVKNEHAFGI
jgi:hypothetical protein